MRKKILCLAATLVLPLIVFGCNHEGPAAVNDTILISQYRGLEVNEIEPIVIMEDDVEARIAQNIEASITTREVKRKSRQGDVVNIDYKGKIDGKEFSGGSAQGVDVEIGSNTYVEAYGKYKGFEEQLTGHKAGDKFKLKVRFPDDYSEELKGRVASFDVTMNMVSEKEIPELTDEWVAANSEKSRTVAEYKEEIRQELQKEAEGSMDSTLRNEVQEKLLENTKFINVPTEEIDKSYEESLAQYTEYAQSAGIPFTDFISEYLGTTEDDLKLSLKKEAEDSVKLKYAVKLIAGSEKLTLSEKDYQKEAQSLAGDYGYDDLDAFEKEYNKEEIMDYLQKERVFKFLVSNCKQVKAESDTMQDSPAGDKPVAADDSGENSTEGSASSGTDTKENTETGQSEHGQN